MKLFPTRRTIEKYTEAPGTFGQGHTMHRKMLRESAKTIAALIVAASSIFAGTDDTVKPKIDLKSISIADIDWSRRSANTTVTVEIENPGPAFTVKEASYRLRLNEKDAGEGKSDKEIIVPANSSVSVELPFTVTLSALPDVAWSTVSTGFKVHYEVETEFTVPAVAFLTPRIKASFSGDLSPTAKLSTWSDKLRERLASKQ